MLNKKKDQIHPNENNNTNNAADNESLGERIKRTTNNSFVRVKGLCKKSDKLARKKYKEHRLENRKKAFGVEYMNLLETGTASPQQLNQCMDKATAELNAIRQEIAAIQAKTERIDQKTKQKLILSKKDQTTTTPSVTVTTTTTTTSALTSPAWISPAEPDYNSYNVAATTKAFPVATQVIPTAPYYEPNPYH